MVFDKTELVEQLTKLKAELDERKRGEMEPSIEIIKELENEIIELENKIKPKRERR